MTMRRLSLRDATRCEDAKEHVCKCRCGGALHGAKRGTGEAFFDALPEDDPHHRPSDARVVAQKRAERERIMNLRAEARATNFGDYD